MRDLVDPFLPWVLSWPTAVHVLGLAALVAVAFWCGKTRSVGRFFLIATLVLLATAIPAIATAASARSAAAGILWLLSIIAVYAVVLGVLVAKGARLRILAGVSTLLLVVQVPLSLISGIVLACVVGHDCL